MGRSLALLVVVVTCVTGMDDLAEVVANSN